MTLLELFALPVAIVATIFYYIEKRHSNRLTLFIDRLSKETTHFVWKDSKKVSPSLKITLHPQGFATEEISQECLVTDGKEIWVDDWYEDMGFEDGITHFIELREIDKPKA